MTTHFTHLLVIAVQYPTVQEVSSQLPINVNLMTLFWYKLHSFWSEKKTFKYCLATSQVLKKFQRLGRKSSTHWKVYLMQWNYTSYILLHPIWEHYQPDDNSVNTVKRNVALTSCYYRKLYRSFLWYNPRLNINIVYKKKTSGTSSVEKCFT